jgi:putative hydrolase of the HAD superfamily
MARYPIVLFDVGETLVGPGDSYGAVYHRVLAGLGVALDKNVLEQSIRETSADLARRIPAGTDRFAYFDGGESEYWRRFVADVLHRVTGRASEARFVRLALERLWEAFGRASAWRVYDDALPALDALRRRGARLGVVSNWDSRLPRLLELLGLASYFEAVGVSHIEGMEKPDPAIFHRVLGRLGGNAREALHVGNVLELDVAGARAAGIDGVLLDRNGDVRGGGGTVRDLRELPRIAAEGLDPAR